MNNNNKRILYIQDWFGFGGINRVTACKENYLVQHGYEVHNLCMDNRADRSSDYPYDARIRFHAIEKADSDRLLAIPLIGRLLRYVWFRYRFIRLLFQIRPALIVTVRDYIEPLSVLLCTCRMKRILEFHCAELPGNYQRAPLAVKLRKRLRYRCYHLVSLTERDRELRERLFGTGCSDAIPNPLPLTGKPVPEAREKIVLALGRFHPQKGYDRLIPAWKSVAAKHPDWSLHLYGAGGEKERYAEMVRREGLAGRIRIQDAVQGVEPLLDSASLYVLSSRYEGFPLVLLEAMQRGLPCVSVDCPSGPREIIRDGEDGFVVPDADLGALADKVNYLIEHPAERTAMGIRARENIKRYAPDAIMKQWVALFNRLCV